MRKLNFSSCELFMTSGGQHFPTLGIPHIVMMGRSNVGKSSLINDLVQKSIARTSSLPGKTDVINFYLIDGAFFLVDLPGYGYAIRSKTEKAKWRTMINNYVDQYFEQIYFTQLLDSRHMPSAEDRLVMDWIIGRGKNPLFIFTKIDKLKKAERTRKLQELALSLQAEADYIAYSVEEKSSREVVRQKIKDLLEYGAAEKRDLHLSGL